MKIILLLFTLILSPSISLGVETHEKNENQEPATGNDIFEKLRQKTYPDGYKKKGYPSDLLVSLFHEATSELIDHVDFRRSMWTHRLGLELTEESNLSAKEPKKEIELDLQKGASAYEVYRAISLSSGWHIAEVKDKVITINCHHRPQIDEK